MLTRCNLAVRNWKFIFDQIFIENESLIERVMKLGLNMKLAPAQSEINAKYTHAITNEIKLNLHKWD